MNMVRKLSTFAMAACLAATPLILGCGGESAQPKVAQVQPGDMPAGASWTGVYFSPLFGHLHIEQDGNTVKGKWIRPVKDRWGELHGEAVGDLLHFEWTEHTIGAIGPNSSSKGKGYFKYKRPAGDNVDDTVVGEIGRGIDEVGLTWDAIKQRNMTPDLASIGGTGATDIGGGDWDGDNQEAGKPEAPVAP
jgi:hypothetical protein